MRGAPARLRRAPLVHFVIGVDSGFASSAFGNPLVQPPRSSTLGLRAGRWLVVFGVLSLLMSHYMSLHRRPALMLFPSRRRPLAAHVPLTPMLHHCLPNSADFGPMWARLLLGAILTSMGNTFLVSMCFVFANGSRRFCGDVFRAEIRAFGSHRARARRWHFA